MSESSPVDTSPDEQIGHPGDGTTPESLALIDTVIAIAVDATSDFDMEAPWLS